MRPARVFQNLTYSSHSDTRTKANVNNVAISLSLSWSLQYPTIVFFNLNDFESSSTPLLDWNQLYPDKRARVS